MRHFRVVRKARQLYLFVSDLADVTLLSRLWLLYSQSSRVGSAFTAGGKGLRSGPQRATSPRELMNLEGMVSKSV